MSEKMKMGSEQELNAMWNLLKAAVSDLPDGRRQNVLVGIANYAEAYAAGIRAAVLGEVRQFIQDCADGLPEWKPSQCRIRAYALLTTLENPNE